MKERLSADIVAAVASGEADIGVVAMEEMEAPHPALDYWPYRIDQLVLLAPPAVRWQNCPPSVSQIACNSRLSVCSKGPPCTPS